MTRWIPLFLISAMLFAGLVLADEMEQTDSQISYGDTIEGELNNDIYAVEYNFEGVLGDVVVVQMRRTDFQSDMDNPAVQLFAPDGTALADSSGIGSVTIAAALPEDGVYKLVATREDGAEGSSVGPYVLRLLAPERLTNGAKTEAEASPNNPAYFTVDTALPFVVSYVKDDGEFYPAVNVNIIETEPDAIRGLGTLVPIVQLQGEALSRGVFGVEPVSDVYIISIERQQFQIVIGEPQVRFSLSLEINE